MKPPTSAAAEHRVKPTALSRRFFIKTLPGNRLLELAEEWENGGTNGVHMRDRNR
jgi:hypothetical protein